MPADEQTPKPEEGFRMGLQPEEAFKMHHDAEDQDVEGHRLRGVAVPDDADPRPAADQADDDDVEAHRYSGY